MTHIAVPELRDLRDTSALSEALLPLPHSPNIRAAWGDTECRDLLERVIRNGMMAGNSDMAELFVSRITELCASDCSNEQIYESLASLWRSERYASFFEELKNQDEESRIERRVDQVSSLIPFSQSPSSLCDIGCGDGLITSGLAKRWGLKQSNVYGADVFDRIDPQAEFQQLQMEDESRIPLADSSIAAVTALMTLHHHDRPQHIVQEMARILKPGGVAIIRESDTLSSSEHMFQAVLDHLYYRVYNLLPGIPEPDSHRSAVEWCSLFEQAGFKLIQLSYPEPDSPINPVHLVFVKT